MREGGRRRANTSERASERRKRKRRDGESGARPNRFTPSLLAVMVMHTVHMCVRMHPPSLSRSLARDALNVRADTHTRARTTLFLSFFLSSFLSRRTHTTHTYVRVRTTRARASAKPYPHSCTHTLPRATHCRKEESHPAVSGSLRARSAPKISALAERIRARLERRRANGGGGSFLAPSLSLSLSLPPGTVSFRPRNTKCDRETITINGTSGRPG